MSDVRILSDQVINKIAAGEVIERPASVVKELVENSIDSQAAKISIDIKKAGRFFIKVIDDGSGMSEQNALLSLERHATSKISSEDDIFSIVTLGFRGEAVPSIASISKMTITTREPESIEGTQIRIEGGVIKKVIPAACPSGTAVTVRNLFFNTPVRLRYLKSDAIENSEIIEVVKNLALAHPSISFSLISNNSTIFKTPGNGKLDEAIISIFGIKVFETLIPVKFSSILELEGMQPSPIKISGFLGTPEGARTSRNMTHFFVNGRCVNTPLLLKAVTNAYGPVIPPKKYPYVFISIKINPELLDVNIHPSKKEIKFQNERTMFSILNSVAVKTLQTEKVFQINAPAAVEVTRKPGKDLEEQPGLLSFDTMFHGTREIFSEEDFISSEQLNPAIQDRGPDISEPAAKPEPEKIPEKAPETDMDMKSLLKHARAAGQVLATYLIAEHRDGFILIDQHAAHEKIVFEKLQKEFSTRQCFESQRILFPVLIELTPADIALLKDKDEILRKFGFEIEDFGDNTFIIKSIPLIFGTSSTKNDIYQLLDMVMGELSSRKVTDAVNELIAGFACKKAIKANEQLNIEAQQALINELSTLDDPTRCPHGRPTVLSFTNDYLRKIFRRS